MTIFGYARVSTDGQSVAAQVADLRAAGAAKVYSETVSGAASNRAELAKVLRVLQPGDVLMVTRLDRLARSTRDLLNVLHSWASGRLASGAWSTPGRIRQQPTDGCCSHSWQALRNLSAN